MPSSWNHQPVQRKKKHELKDNFFLGFLPSFLLPPLLTMLIFSVKWTTEQNIFYAMYRMAQRGFLSHDMMASLIPSLVLIIFFSAIKKEKASIGSFVGLCPWLVLTIIYM